MGKLDDTGRQTSFQSASTSDLITVYCYKVHTDCFVIHYIILQIGLDHVNCCESPYTAQPIKPWSNLYVHDICHILCHALPVQFQLVYWFSHTVSSHAFQPNKQASSTPLSIIYSASDELLPTLLGCFRGRRWINTSWHSAQDVPGFSKWSSSPMQPQVSPQWFGQWSMLMPYCW